MSAICNSIVKRLEASCSGGCRPRCGPRCRRFGRARPCRALRRPPRPLAPLRCAYVSLQVLRCACVVLVQAHGNLLLSVHRWGDRACARARVWACAAQALPNELTHARNGSLVPELPNYTGRGREREGTRHGALLPASTLYVDMRVAARSRCILSTGVVILYLWWFACPFSKRFREGRPTTSPRETATPTYTTTHAFEQVRLARSEVRTPRNSTDGLSARVERRPGLYQDCLCARGDIETRCSCKENTRNCASQQP